MNETSTFIKGLAVYVLSRSTGRSIEDAQQALAKTLSPLIGQVLTSSGLTAAIVDAERLLRDTPNNT